MVTKFRFSVELSRRQDYNFNSYVFWVDKCDLDGMLIERLLILSLLSQGKKKMCIAKDRIHIFFCCLKEHSLKTE